jgi:hypothetical protein
VSALIKYQFAMKIYWIFLQLLCLLATKSVQGSAESSKSVNVTNVEETTVKIAEISNHTISNHTEILHSITAKHITTSTLPPKVILIPPANSTAQIKKRKKENST